VIIAGTETDWPPGLERIAVAHENPEKRELGLRLEREYPTVWDAERPGIARVLRTGEPLLVPWVSPDMLQEAAQDPQHLALLQAIGFTSVIVVPLVARGHTLGVLTLATAQSGRRYDERDLRLAEALAQRAGTAVDNARLYRQAQEARDAAERANQAKSDFLATMSHELRTPLNAIGGYAQILELGLRGAVTEAQLKDLARIRRSQEHLLGLINAILAFARLEAGHMRYEIQRVALAPLLHDAVELLAPQASGKGVALGLGPDCDLAVHADPEKVRQVVLNLLSNAVKFTNAGGSVHVECTRAGADVRISVRDTGIGIPEDQLERAFDPFVQVGRELTSTYEGTGLGLAISRDLARGMAGDLWATSRVGHGSTFTLQLPADH
jgi:signal transduction histidine kinase